MGRGLSKPPQIQSEQNLAMGDESKMVIKVDNKELMEYFESWLEDFKRVSEGMLEKINVDRGATLKIPETDFRKLKMLTEALDSVAKKKFGFENVPDFTPIVAAMKSLEQCLNNVHIPEKIDMVVPAMPVQEKKEEKEELKPILDRLSSIENTLKQGIRITNLNDVPMVFNGKK